VYGMCVFVNTNQLWYVDEVDLYVLMVDEWW